MILPEHKPIPAPNEFAPSPLWRLVATINSIDKASLYQMSYAFARRFGWVYVDAPSDTKSFIDEYLRRKFPSRNDPADGTRCPLAEIWTAINKVRVLGPAPVIDTMHAVLAMDEDAEFFDEPASSMKNALLDAMDMVLLPMLDGIVAYDADQLADKIAEILALDFEGIARVKARMASVAV